MRRSPSVVLWHASVILALLLPGTPLLALTDYGQVLVAARSAAAVNRVVPSALPTRNTPPAPSGALSVAVPNGAIDGYLVPHGTVSTPPTNYNYEDPGSNVGSPP